MRNLIAVCMVVLAVGSVAFGEPELKGTPSELTTYLRSLPRSVTLSGESKVEVQANKATVELSIKTTNPSLEAALKSNQTLRASITAKLNEAGIPADKITAAKFSSTPMYGFFGKRPNSYEVRNLVKIMVADEKDFQQIAKIVDQFPEVEYQGITFSNSKEKELKKQAFEQACDDLLKKKAFYESKFGVTLTTRAFSEGISSLQELSGGRIYAKAYSGSVLSRAKEAAQYAATEDELASPFGELAFTATVSGEFEVKTKE